MSKNIENWPELLTVERPGRYMGGELEAQPNEHPDAKGRLLRVALAFPDVYEIAHGHLGHKILYSLLNSRHGFSAERVYAPWPDWEQVLKKRQALLSSLESRRPLSDFDVVGFSLQYELAYTNILKMLALGGLPLLAQDRHDEMPLVVAGGPGAMNPEPLADFFDLFFLGDAENNFLEDMEIIKNWRAEKAPKSELWARLSGRDGIYIPSLFQPVYGPDGHFASMVPLKSGYDMVTRSVAPSLDLSPFPMCQITPLIKPVHDRIVVEIGRGCSRGCRFCQAGYIYRPVRERQQNTVSQLVAQNLKSSGQDEVSFLSLSAGDHTEINQMVSGFMDEYAARTVALSLPSLRVKSLNGPLAQQIKRVRKTGFTLAPEAATQRLRNVINKDLTDDDLFAAAENAFSLGWRTLKLYFMVGLPTETDEDIQAIGALTRRLKKMGRAQINLGVAHFTPKAHTPFQWHPASTIDEINKRLLTMRDAVRTQGLTPKWNEPGASWVESILARGDRRLGRVLKRVHEAGASFEAWGDHFK
ncbi:MAG: TIGR03960 family B12-binding radical SAM protein, partial [Candidatus Adiutrix sp.]